MAKRQPRTEPAWTDVKAKLATFDRLGLLSLIQDLYAAHKDNRTFLHARFGLTADVLKPYKEMLARWLCPDVVRHQDVSITKAEQAIAAYRKAVGEPAGLAELMVYYCERAAKFSKDVGWDDPAFLDALVSMFAQALMILPDVPESDRRALTARLDGVCDLCQQLGYGVGEAMDSLLAEHGDITDIE